MDISEFDRPEFESGFYGGADWDQEYVDLPKTCKRCGATGLYWSIRNGGYRLVTAAGELHQCDYSNRVDMFGDESQ